MPSARHAGHGAAEESSLAHEQRGCTVWGAHPGVPAMPRVVSVALVVLVVALCLACGGGTPATKPRRSLDVERVSAADLHRDYTADRDAAERKWTGKTIEVSGQVGLVYTDHDTPRILIVAGARDVYLGCWFHKSRLGEVAALKPGQSVRVVGVLGGRSLVDADKDVSVTMKDCALVK